MQAGLATALDLSRVSVVKADLRTPPPRDGVENDCCPRPSRRPLAGLAGLADDAETRPRRSRISVAEDRVRSHMGRDDGRGKLSFVVNGPARPALEFEADGDDHIATSTALPPTELCAAHAERRGSAWRLPVTGPDSARSCPQPESGAAPDGSGGGTS